MAEVINIIGIAWLASLITSFYIDRAVQRKLPIRKPFGCEKCLAFWIAILYFTILALPIQQIITFASLTSLTATLIRGIINKLNT